MSAENQIAPAAQKARFIPTEAGGFIDTGALHLGADGEAIEVLEWSKDLGLAKFEGAQELAAALGPEWLVASPHEWTGIFNYNKEDPATDAPGISSDWHWTRQNDPSSSDGAFCVSPHGGNVGWDDQYLRGRVRAVRRVRASQFLTLGL